MIKEAIFIKLIHFLTKFNQYVYLTRFWEVEKLSLSSFDDSSHALQVIFVVKGSNSKSYAHVLKLFILIDRFIL